MTFEEAQIAVNKAYMRCSVPGCKHKLTQNYDPYCDMHLKEIERGFTEWEETKDFSVHVTN